MTQFRDPRPVDEAARERRVGMARALVGAPVLPQPLPRFGLTLLDVEAIGDAIELVVGNEAPIVRARIEAPSRAAGEPFRIAVSIREVQPIAVRFRAATSVMRERLALGITEEKWEQARVHRDTLRKLPVGVPLSHLRQLIEGIDPPAALVRTGFGCNQDCGFCWQSRDWAGESAAQVRTWIEDLRALGALSLTISGGEPTLDRALVEHVRYARELGMQSIVIETNAIQIGKRPALAAELRDAGLTRAFVSLHSADPAISDAVTRAPGTHARTIAGTRALLEAGLHVILNAVVTAETVGALSAMPAFIRRTFGRGGGFLGGLSVSVPAPPWEQSIAAKINAAPEELRASLAQTIAAAQEHDLLLFGLDGPCGPPLCAFAADRRVTDLAPKGPVSFRRHVTECERCSVRGSCHGVQHEAYEAFGARAVAPIA